LELLKFIQKFPQFSSQILQENPQANERKVVQNLYGTLINVVGTLVQDLRSAL
jgi:hypothetical protein